jgi:hypothetical protein
MFSNARGTSLIVAYLLLALTATTLFTPKNTNGSNVGDIVTDPKDRKTVFGGCDSDPYEALRPFVSGSAKVIPTKDGNTNRECVPK